jgi:hypothetical protein
MCTVGERGSFSLQELQAEDLNEVSLVDLGEDLQEIRRRINAWEAEFQRRLHRFDKDQGFTTDGSLSAKAWLRWNCRITFSSASDRVEVARQMQSLQLTSQALAAGEISYQHASMIARTAERLGEKFEGEAEEILVTVAKKEDPVVLRRAIVFLQHCIEPDGVLNEANEADERRFLHLSQTFGGLFVLNGQFGADDGATLQTALNSLMPAPSLDNTQPASRRRADALIELARQQLDGGGLPEVGGQKPHLMVTVEMETLSRQPGSPAAELEWSEPIPAETARRLGCDCTLTPIVDGKPGTTTRVVPGSMKRALVARDKGCRFPGCDRPPAWTDAHHIRHWADGGPTMMSNLILLCRRHHRLVHEGRWSLVRAGDGLLQVVAPP